MRWRSGAGSFRVALPLSILLLAVAWIRFGPLPPELLDPSERISTRVTDRRGITLYEALSSDGTRSEWIGADELTPQIILTTLAAEDRRFFSHPGVDPLSIGRAAMRNIRAGKAVEGGSTITQQVVKQLVRSRHRTWAVKVREAVLALRLEHRHSKNEVLALYLNLTPYGNQLVGAQAASRAYFGSALANLTLAQASMLAVVPQSPTRFNPGSDAAGARRRQLNLLRTMERIAWVSPEEARIAASERVQIRKRWGGIVAPHFVQQALARTGGRRAVRIETTLDAGLQRDVAGIIDFHRSELERHGASAVAVVVLDNRTGEWLAWEGSGNFFGNNGGAIDGAVTPRQPGSALKPFTYALAFESGTTPATILADVPSYFPTSVEGVLYSPQNYDGVFRGPLRARAALAGSENVPAVAALDRIGVGPFLSFLRSAGLTTLDKRSDHYGLGLTLGGAEVRLDELVASYAMLARGGTRITPRGVSGMVWRGEGRRELGDGGLETGDGRRATGEGREERILSKRAAFWVTDILSDDRAREFIFGAGGPLAFPFPVAVKTGTSQAYRDNWTVGYTRDLTVGVWVGNFDRKELRSSSGVTGAAPIFHDVLLAARKRIHGGVEAGDEPILEPDPTLEQVEICLLSGGIATPRCPSGQHEWLEPGSVESCHWHRDSGISWPTQYRQWARANGLVPAEASMMSRPLTAQPPFASAEFRIESPPAGALYMIDPTLRQEFQALSLRASGPDGTQPVRWHVDGRLVGTARLSGRLEWPLVSGEHEVIAEMGGKRERVRIVVR